MGLRDGRQALSGRGAASDKMPGVRFSRDSPDPCDPFAPPRTEARVKIVHSPETPPRRAVEEFVQRHQRSVRGYLAVLGCPGHLLDDLVQDVFLSVLASRFEDRGNASSAAFLRKSARHLFLKAMYRERRQPTLIDLGAIEVAWTEYERDDAGEAYLAALRQCLTGVRERARAVIELRYRERLRRTAIASRLGMSESGVKSVLVRTRKWLRECIERRLAS